jgi:hypothetical protein
MVILLIGSMILGYRPKYVVLPATGGMARGR